MKTQVARKVLYVTAVLLMVGCTSPYRWEPTREELEPLDCVEGILPQEGTLLKLRLDYSFFTKFQAIEYTQQYRYRVLIDGEIYSYGVNTERIKSLSIPLMANDGYTRKTIVVEGSEALDYISSKEDKVNPSITWGEWHELYRGEQECLPAEQPQQYSSIKDSRLKFVIAGKNLTVEFAKNGTAEAFKRFLSKDEIKADVRINSFIRLDAAKEGELISKLRASIPDNHTNESKTGTLYYADGDLIIDLEEFAVIKYNSIIGTFLPEALSILETLNRHDEGYQATVTLSLE